MCKHGQPGKLSFSTKISLKLLNSSRQCMCCYRDSKNLERFGYLTRGLIYMAVTQLKQLVDKSLEKKSSSTGQSEKNNEETTEESKSEDCTSDAKRVDTKPKEKESSTNPEDEVENVEVVERDKLLILVSKVFLLNFPLYVAFKHTVQSKVDDLTQQEIANLSMFCDLHDSEVPMYLLKNVSWFCKIGGLMAMTKCFTHLTTDALPVSTAHAMISIGE